MTTLLIENPAGLNHVDAARPPRTGRAAGGGDAGARRARLFRPSEQEAPLATDADLLLAHPQAYVDAVRAAMPEAGMVALDPDTHASPGSWDAALKGRGRHDRRRGCGARRARDQRLRRHAPARPPRREGPAMGFCFFGNIAIGALHALERRACPASRWSISTCTTATARRISCGTSRARSSPPATRCRFSPAPARRRNGAGRTTS
jgi:hypothetical protein